MNFTQNLWNSQNFSEIQAPCQPCYFGEMSLALARLGISRILKELKQLDEMTKSYGYGLARLCTGLVMYRIRTAASAFLGEIEERSCVRKSFAEARGYADRPQVPIE